MKKQNKSKYYYSLLYFTIFLVFYLVLFFYRWLNQVASLYNTFKYIKTVHYLFSQNSPKMFDRILNETMPFFYMIRMCNLNILQSSKNVSAFFTKVASKNFLSKIVSRYKSLQIYTLNQIIFFKCSFFDE